MDEQQPEAPWATLYRGDLKSGMAYPVRTAEIADALRAAGAQVGSLSLIGARADGRQSPKAPPGLLLLIADWQERRDLPFQAGGGSLAVYAVPAERRAEAHELMAKQALADAARWLADAAGRGPVWRDLRHERWITVRDGALVITDREGGHWATVR